MAIDINGIITWLEGWFYKKEDVNTYLNAKANKNLTNANMNVVTDSSGNITTEAKPVIPDVSGKIDTAGTGLSKSGTTLNHSNSITAQTTAVFKKIKYDGQGHITGTADVGEYDLPIHSHGAIKVYDNDYVAYTHINPLDRHQSSINSAIDTAIGDLQSIKAIEVVSTLPTASSSTMGKLYIISENSKVNVYYTKQNGSSYSWHKMDTDILDELDLSWTNITDKPSTFTPSSHSSSATTYGVGTSSNYGHNKVINNLTTSSYADGNSLSAYQGYVLKGLIDDLEDEIVSFDASNIDFEPASNIWGEYVQVVSTVAQGLDMLKEISNSLNANLINKQDNITSIVLVPKSTDASGKIIFYTGDEPS